ncbi:MAG: carbamoyl-phosphate synthase large subunit [Elusimicrobia bacterium]|nr:carbamoyl-phosphate synthase large subunit [Candidatus Obscuribacterium magneticum]
MSKRTDINKILIIGSGPIIIGQACEFDYSGTQAVKALKKEGFHIILINSNPATIMTDPELADATYIEPLTADVLEAIIAKEKPDALLPTLGGQTGLNLAVEVAKKGILKKYGVEMIGANLEAIEKAEDRELFKKTMNAIGIETPRSGIARTITEAEQIAQEIGFPLIIRPSFTLGGTGSSIAYNKEEYLKAASFGLSLSPISEILIEESLEGWKEFELEVMRDKADQCIVICSIENVDPMGVHTGDSITVAPTMTLTDKEYQRMRDASFACIRAIGVETGGSNIQFAMDPQTGRMLIIEMNPRVSRSSALASKATGFPIAKLAALLAIGYRLDELPNDITQKTPASFEPTIDYTVVKIPRFAFEKFAGVPDHLGTQMKSVGEVMALGRNFKQALQKAFRGLETGRGGLGCDGKSILPQLEQAIKEKDSLNSETWTQKNPRLLDDLKEKIRIPNSERLFAVKAGLQLGLTVEDIFNISKIDPWFTKQIEELVQFEKYFLESIKDKEGRVKINADLILEAKRLGYSDIQLAHLLGQTEGKVREIRKKLKIQPVFNLVDTCAAEFEAYTPYYYSCYGEEDETKPSNKKKVMILGGGPNRIGQGIEFDYCCVHAVQSLQEEGIETIMVNCNPETVSTDYDTADRLYFEPLTLEDVLSIVENEKPLGLIVQFGGQTPLNLAIPLEEAGVKILGTSPDSIDLAEDRGRFGRLINKLGIPQPENGVARSYEEARDVASQIGYPVMVRPSYVLGGRAMEIVDTDSMLKEYISRATMISPDHPILIDKYLDNAVEVDVDAISDGENTYIGGIMEHIEAAGVHSGDSACVIPQQKLSLEIVETIEKTTKTLAKALKVKGLMNVQLAIKDNVVYLLEVNPRGSRTVPYVSKATGLPLAKLAAKLMLGKTLPEILPDFEKRQKQKLPWTAVKEAVLPWVKFPGVNIVLGPEMRSTGEVMGIDTFFPAAYAKSQAAANSPLPSKGPILMSLKNTHKEKALGIAKRLLKIGFSLTATAGTAEALSKAGLPVKTVNKIAEGRPNVVDIISNREVALVINTPSGARSRSDGWAIRSAATAVGIPIITTLAAAEAATTAMELSQKKDWTIRSIQDYYKLSPNLTQKQPKPSKTPVNKAV